MTEFSTNIQTNRFSYRIEPNPDGGFIAKPSEPGMPSIEGETREEVQQKIEAAVTEMIGNRLPAILKLGTINIKVNRNVNITRRAVSGSQAGNLGSAAPSENSSSVSAAPIVPEHSATVLWVLVGLMVLAGLIYFSYLHS